MSFNGDFLAEVRDIAGMLDCEAIEKVAIALVGIAQIPSGERVSAPFEGEIGEPNTFGGYLLFMIAIAGGIALETRRLRLRTICVGLMGLMAVPFAFANTIGVSSFVSVGDKYDVSSNDMLAWWEQDAQTKLAVLYVESFGSPRKFARTARRVGQRMPVLTVVGLQFGALLAGAIVTETIFSWPGIGRLTVQAISSRDYPLLQGCILVIALSYVVVNLLTDVLYSVIDPRVRLS